MSDVLARWVDGVPTDVLPADDRGLQYGDGLFETLLIRGGKPRFLEAHLARLSLGCTRLAIPFAAQRELRSEIADACAQAPALAVLKIVVTRGSALRRGYVPDGRETPRRVVTLWEAVPLPESLRDGVSMVVASARLGDNPLLAGIKHLSRIENVMAAEQARAAGAFDALLTGADGRLISGAMTNLFVLRGGVLQTPPVDRAGVAGIMRGIVLRECASLDIAIAEHHLTPADLHSADEAFITNARIGVVPVRRVGEHLIHMNDVTQRIARHVEEIDA
jgi:4-amino-4-deoxychorismate lyase